jgi:hypothetical protein
MYDYFNLITKYCSIYLYFSGFLNNVIGLKYTAWFSGQMYVI